MKNIRFGFALVAAALFPMLIVASCDNNNTGGGGGMYGTPVPTSTPRPASAVTVTAMSTGGSGYAYAPNSFTITHGQSVRWNTSTIHPLNIDDSSGSCLVSGTTAFPFTYTFMNAGTYHFHCGVHSSCGNGVCPNPSTCSGMVGTITVN